MAEAEGSLFPRAMMERCRIQPFPSEGGSPDARRADDSSPFDGSPPPGSSRKGDAWGIIVAGRCQGRLYVLPDCSIEASSPERWAGAVARAAEQWGASHVVAEANQGGAMVRSVLRARGTDLRVV